jgi:hypothetical protein
MDVDIAPIAVLAAGSAGPSRACVTAVATPSRPALAGAPPILHGAAALLTVAAVATIAPLAAVLAVGACVDQDEFALGGAVNHKVDLIGIPTR